MTFTLTPEQDQAREAFLNPSEPNLIIEAGAGTGKTSTLVALAEATSDQGQYIAFNKAIVTDAGRKLPSNVAANTAHSLAYRAVGHQFGKRLRGSKRMTGNELAHTLGVRGKDVFVKGSVKHLNSGFLASHATNAVVNFCHTADEVLTERHFTYIEGIDPIEDGGRRTFKNNNLLAIELLDVARKIWADVQREDGILPYRHDYYLKAWQLSNPRIHADFILFDEAQDANPVMQAIVAAQDHAQVVWVGDSQQSIYGFTGAVNAMANIESSTRVFLTQSFRFGQAVADKANEVLDLLGAELRLKGLDSIESTVEPITGTPDATLCRTNAKAVNTFLARLEDGGRPHIVGGGRQIVDFAKAAQHLKAGRKAYHPELSCFKDWDEVKDYVENDAQGSELKLMVGLVDQFGTQVIIESLDRMPSEKAADSIISTAHKSKGREWATVQLADDFVKTGKDGDEPAPPSPEEMRLLYVAVTRARNTLDCSSVPLLRLTDRKESAA